MNESQQNSTDKYQLKELISENEYKIYRGADKKTLEKVIIKQMPSYIEYNGFPSVILREITILKQLSHPNIIGIREIYFAEKDSNNHRSMRIVYENMATDLRSYMIRAKAIPFPLIKSYAFQLFCGIAYLHSKGIIHRGITPSNILINASGFLKLSGFSNSRLYSIPESAVTPEAIFIFYRAPEALVDPTNYGTAADVWSAGCVIGELFSRRILFPGDSPIDQIMHIFNALGTPSEEEWHLSDNISSIVSSLPKCQPKDFRSFLSSESNEQPDSNFGNNNSPIDADPQLLDLLQKIFVYDPNKRITALEAIKHPFFSSISKQLSEICMKDIEA
ncbi:hypothetical protein M9Y10_038422 [Tritrichomonas musculus]|uniref:cyclin-dependent kinase n=1 Tax=Tritrichomonas musculus TaxID=1915356 RepID=A0ABR2K8Y9_9EUKA